MAMSFIGANRAENPDLAQALMQQQNMSNALKAQEQQQTMQMRNSNAIGGAMLAQNAPDGTFYTPGAETAALDSAAMGGTEALGADAIASAGLDSAAMGGAELAGEAAIAEGLAGAGAGGAGAGGAAAGLAGVTPVGWGAMGLLAANQLGLFDNLFD